MAIASGIGGVTLVHGLFYSYTSFDQLSWILVAYFVTRLTEVGGPPLVALIKSQTPVATWRNIAKPSSS